MIVSKTVTEQIQNASWIRRMFEEGARLKRERGPDNVFDFTLGNPDLEPPPVVLETAARILAENKPRSHAYMPNAGFPEVRSVIAGRLARSTGLPYTADSILMTVGAAGGLNTVLKSILDPGDEVILLAPYFAEYIFYVLNHGGQPSIVYADERFLPDPKGILKAVTPRTKAIIINSPNNPTGVVYPAGIYEELQNLLGSLDQQVLLITDEPYKPLVFGDMAVPEIPSLFKRTVVAYSWSKALAIPGERIGFLAISPLIEEAKELFDACCFSQRVLGFVNAPALWQWVVAEVGEARVDAGVYKEKCDLLWDALTRIGYTCVKPDGGFYLFPETPIPEDIAFVQLLKEEGVLAVPGSGFGWPGNIRLSVTVPKKTIERALAGFYHAFQKAKTRG